MVRTASFLEVRKFRAIKVLSETVRLFFHRPLTYVAWTWAPLAAAWMLASAVDRVFGPQIDWSFGARSRPPDWFIGPQLLMSAVPPLIVILLTSLSAAASLHIARQDLLQNPAPIGATARMGLLGALPLTILTALTVGATLFALALYVVPGLAVASAWAMAGPVCVFERRGPFESLNRSYKLTKGFRWKILSLLTIFVVAILGLVLLGLMIEHFALMHGAPLLASQSGWLLVHLAAAPFFCVGAAVAYHEVRAIKEGVDLEGVGAVFE